MTKFVAVLMLLSLAPVARAECINPSTIRLVDKGIDLGQLTENVAKLREEGNSSNVPYLGLYDIAELSSHYQAGDLYYSYEFFGPNKKALSGGTALVRGNCILLLFPDWAA